MLERDKKYEVPVEGAQRLPQNGKLYFNVTIQGNEFRVPAYEFQRSDPPSKITCIYKGGNTLVQDPASITEEFYTKGEIYEFRVLYATCSNGYYTIIDDRNGFTYQLDACGIPRLERFQRIACEITDIIEGIPTLKLCDYSSEMCPQPEFTIDEAVYLDPRGAMRAEHLQRIMKIDPVFAEAMQMTRSHDPRWVIAVVETVDKHMAEWLNGSTSLTPARRQAVIRRGCRWLDRFSAMCTNLLENSDYPDLFAEKEALEIQDILSRVISHCEDYNVALHLFLDNRQTTYIDDTLHSLKRTRFLYQPERRMRVVMSVFTLHTDYVRRYIGDIFDIIRDNHSQPRFMEIFRTAFVEMLDIFVMNESKFVDTFDKASIREMIEALAIQLLLTDSKDSNNYDLYRSMLYRYASMIVSKGTSALVHKAFAALVGQTSQRLEFGWEDLRDINLMCNTRLVRQISGSDYNTSVANVFEGNNAVLKFTPDHMSLAPALLGSEARSVLPADLFGDMDVSITLNERIRSRANTADNMIEPLRLMWAEIENSIFSTPIIKEPEAVAAATLKEGDEVTIWVTEADTSTAGQFICSIADSDVSGKGYLSVSDIVPFNVNPTIDEFRDYNTGKPFLLRARISELLANGFYRFTLFDSVQAAAARMASDLQDRKEELNVRVMGGTDTKYLGLTTEGISLAFPHTQHTDNDNLRRGDFAIVTINADTKKSKAVNYIPEQQKLYVNAGYRQRWGLDPASYDATNFVVEAFYRMMSYYSDGKLLDTSAIPQQDINADNSAMHINYVSPDKIAELMRLLDTLAMICRHNYLGAYNYLSLARLLALMKEDSFLAECYDTKKELVKAIHLFGENGKVDAADLHKLERKSAALSISSPDVRNKLNLLRVLAQLDQPWQTSTDLLSSAINTDNHTLSAIARLVMSYNLLRGIRVFDQRKALKREIYMLLDFHMPDDTDITRVAEREDLHNEFKSSMIYPAENYMQPEERVQALKLMQVVASFLNSDGGTLYIGVNNQGIPSGLHEDFKYLNNGHEDYDLQDVQDKMRNKFICALREHLGLVQDDIILYPDYLTFDFDYIDNKHIARVDVLPCPVTISMKGTDSIYVRIDSTSQPLRDDNERRQFVNARKKSVTL